MADRDILDEFKQLINGLSPDIQDQSLELLLLQMEPQRARLLRLCAIPHHFDVPIMQALASDMSLSEIEASNNEFASLPFIYENNGTYSIHDATRTQLFDFWLAADRRAEFGQASCQLVEFFTNIASHSDSYTLDEANRSKMFHLIGVDQAKGFSDFEHLFHTARLQFKLSECESLIKLVHEYDKILNPVYANWLMYHDGKLAYDLRQWDDAIANFNQALANCSGIPKLYLKALNRLGMVHEAKREWTQAAKCYQTALSSIDSEATYRSIKARLLHNLAITELKRGNQEEANRLLHESIGLHQQTDNFWYMATAYNSLGTLYRELRHPKKAVDAYEKSLNCLIKSGDRFRKAQLYNNLGAIYADIGNWEKSKELFQKSLDIKKEAADTLGQAKTLNNLARVYQNMNKAQEAVAVIKKAINLFSSLQDGFNMATTKRNLAVLYHSTGDDTSARQELKSAIEIFQRIKEPLLAQKATDELDALDKKIGLPWWAWAPIILIILLVFLVVVLIVIEA